MKHTPGPWFARESKQTLTIESAHNDGIVVARIGSNDTCLFSDESNACLIAAAPELLEALRHIQGLVCGKSKLTVTELEIVETINVAIAKATKE